MSEVLKSLVRELLAAGSAPAQKEGEVYLFNEEDGDLMQQLWTTSGPGKQTCIASGVKSDSPALDLIVDEEHLVFFVDNSSTLSCRRYNSEEQEWEEYPLGHIQQIAAHSQSKLSGCLTTDGAIVFFQSPTNQLQAIVKKGGLWCKGESIVADASSGTPHRAACIPIGGSEQKLQLAYADNENRVHIHSKNKSSGSWEDQVVENAKFETLITHLTVQPKEDGKFEMLVLSDSKLVWMDETGKRTELGKVVENKFIPLTDAECIISLGYFRMGNINYGNIFAAPGARIYM